MSVDFGWGVETEEPREYYAVMSHRGFKLHFGGERGKHQDEINAVLYCLGCVIPPRNIESTRFAMSPTEVRIYVKERKE